MSRFSPIWFIKHTDCVLVKEKLNSSALAMELCLSYINPLACPKQFARAYTYSSTQCLIIHSGETDEANCSWLHPVWPPPKRPDRDSTFCVESRASTELIFCIHRDCDTRNNVYKPCRLVCDCCRDISA